jgi:hypothetical protein
MVWLAAVGWLLVGGSIGTGAALASALLSLLLFALPGSVRRRRSGLRYVEMGKEPVGLL